MVLLRIILTSPSLSWFFKVLYSHLHHCHGSSKYYINIPITVMVLQSIKNQAGPAQDPWPPKPKPSRSGPGRRFNQMAAQSLGRRASVPDRCSLDSGWSNRLAVRVAWRCTNGNSNGRSSGEVGP